MAFNARVSGYVLNAYRGELPQSYLEPDEVDEDEDEELELLESWTTACTNSHPSTHAAMAMVQTPCRTWRTDQHGQREICQATSEAGAGKNQRLAKECAPTNSIEATSIPIA